MYRTMALTYITATVRAGMVELVDAPDSKSGGLRPLGVRVPLPALGFAPDSGTFSARRRLRTRPSLLFEA